MRPRRLLPAIAALGIALGLPAAAAVPSDVDLRWLAGAWCGGAAGETLEETWFAPMDGQLVGMSRSSRAGRATGYEFMRIATVDGVPTFHAQPGGKPPTAFPAVDAGPGWIRFANDHHDFPQWVEYRREGERLLAWIGGPGENDEQAKVEFRYARCAPGAG